MTEVANRRGCCKGSDNNILPILLLFFLCQDDCGGSDNNIFFILLLFIIFGGGMGGFNF